MSGNQQTLNPILFAVFVWISLSLQAKLDCIEKDKKKVHVADFKRKKHFIPLGHYDKQVDAMLKKIEDLAADETREDMLQLVVHYKSLDQKVKSGAVEVSIASQIQCALVDRMIEIVEQEVLNIPDGSEKFRIEFNTKFQSEKTKQQLLSALTKIIGIPKEEISIMVYSSAV